MKLAAIVAHDPNLAIGKNGSLPWHYPEDLKYFKDTTTGHPILMGRKVFENLNKKPLTDRENVILSRSHNYDHVATFSSIDDALEYLKDEEVVFIIGGGEIYRQLMNRTEELFITEIHAAYGGDVFFPEYRDKIGSIWKETKRNDKQDMSFVVYERIKK